MHHFMTRQTWLSLLMSLSLINSTPASAASSAPIEKVSEQLTRTDSTGGELKTHFTKNIMKQVPYQANYTVEVPYQDTETYYENVPYQDTETYTDYESYTDSEYKCHTETDYRQECHSENQCYDTPGERQCQTRNDCHTQGGGRQCRSEQVCGHVGGGTSCHNEEQCGTSATGQRICKTKQVCETNPGRQECHTENKCYEVPGEQVCTPRQECHETPGHRECRPQQVCNNVPYNHEVCGYESVVKTRPVTKTRTVTKYRQEQRTRTVTKYRTEDRCCVTKYREEFDHSSELDVVVQFPAEAQLLAGEQETFKISLAGDEAQPSAKIEMSQTIYGYSVVDQKLSGRTYQIKLALVPKYTAEQLGIATISGLALSFEAGQAHVRFADKGQMARVASQYNVQILLAGAVVGNARGTSVGGAGVSLEQNLAVAEALDENQSYDLKLSVQRAGFVLAAPVSFQVQGVYDSTPLEHAGDYSDIGQLTNWDILDVGTQSGLYFMDHTAYNAAVKTSYKVTLQARTAAGLQMIGSSTLDRSSVKVNSEGLSQILLVRDMKIPAEMASRLVTRSAEIQVEVEVIRQSSRLNHGQPIVLKKTFVDRNRD